MVEGPNGPAYQKIDFSRESLGELEAQASVGEQAKNIPIDLTDKAITGRPAKKGKKIKTK